MIGSIIQLLVLVLSVEATYFLSNGNWGLNSKTIAQLASTYWGYNSAMLRNYAEIKGDSWIGFIQLMISIILQLVLISFFNGVETTINNETAPIAIVVGATIFIGSWVFSKVLARIYIKQATSAMEKQNEEAEQKRERDLQERKIQK